MHKDAGVVLYLPTHKTPDTVTALALYSATIYHYSIKATVLMFSKTFFSHEW